MGRVKLEKNRSLHSNTESDEEMQLKIDYHRLHPIVKFNNLIDLNHKFVETVGDVPLKNTGNL
jgi:hypothetical protein